MPYACIVETSLTQTARFKREKNFKTLKGLIHVHVMYKALYF